MSVAVLPMPMLARCDKTPAMSALVTEIAMGIVDSYTAAAAPAPPVYSPDAPYTALFTPRTSRTSRHSTPGSAAEFSPPFALELWSPRLLSQPSPSPSTPRTARSARTPRFDLMALVREEEEHEEVEQQTFQSSPLSRPRGKSVSPSPRSMIPSPRAYGTYGSPRMYRPAPALSTNKKGSRKAPPPPLASLKARPRSGRFGAGSGYGFGAHHIKGLSQACTPLPTVLDCEERETCEVKVKEAVVMSAIARMRSPAVPDDSPTDPFALSLTPAEWLSPRK